MRHDAFICVTWLLHACDMTHASHSNMWHDAFIRVTCWRHIWDMTHTVTCETWLIHLIHTCDMTISYVWHAPSCVEHVSFNPHPHCACPVSQKKIKVSLTRVTWLIHMCDMTHSYVWHDSFFPITGRRRHYAYVWHDSFTCVTWLISHVHTISVSLTHTSSLCFPGCLGQTYEWVMAHINKLWHI